MSPLEVLVRFIAAWLAVGLGLFILAGSLRSVRLAPIAVLYVVPGVAGMWLVLWGLLEFVRVVPW